MACGSEVVFGGVGSAGVKEVVAVRPSDDDRPHNGADRACEECGTILVEGVLVVEPVFTE